MASGNRGAKVGARWCAVLLLLVLSACGTGGGPMPAITKFVANPATVFPGETVVLHWQVEHLEAGSLRLESLTPGAVEPASLGEVTSQSSTAIVVEETTTFRLVASGPGGTTRAETTVTVEQGDAPRIEEFHAAPVISSPGEPVTLFWEVSEAETVTIEPPGEEVDASGEVTVNPDTTTEYLLTASNPFGTSTRSLSVEVRPADRLLFLIAGQSNASGFGAENSGAFPVEGVTESPEDGVRMLTPDLDWVTASEPTHEGGMHSFLVRFGKEVKHATGKDVYLVPAAVAGSALHSWDSDDDHFREAVARSQYASNSLGIPVSAIIWYQGESDTKTEWQREDYVENTDDLLKGLRERLGGAPVIFAQLSKRLWSEALDEPGNNIQGHNLAYQVVRERQRLMEGGAMNAEPNAPGDSEIDEPFYRMVVTHDLPMSDAKHLSAEGQRELGQRIANAYLHITGHPASSGIGPRLEQITVESSPTGSAVLVDLSMPVTAPISESTTEPPGYDGYFAVFVNGQERTDIAIGLDPLDESIIRLALQEPLPVAADIDVRYMPPEGTPLFTWSNNVVKAQVNGLPLPAFGMPVEDLPCDDPTEECTPRIPGLRLAGE